MTLGCHPYAQAQAEFDTELPTLVTRTFSTRPTGEFTWSPNFPQFIQRREQPDGIPIVTEGSWLWFCQQVPSEISILITSITKLSDCAILSKSNSNEPY